MNHTGAKDGLHFFSHISIAAQASGRTAKRAVGRDRLHSPSSPGFLTPSELQHSLPPNGTRGITRSRQKDLIGSITSLYGSRGSWEWNQQSWRWLGESRNGTMPLPSVAQVLMPAAAPVSLAALNTFLIWIRLGLVGAKMICKHWPFWDIRDIDKPPVWEA